MCEKCAQVARKSKNATSVSILKLESSSEKSETTAAISSPACFMMRRKTRIVNVLSFFEVKEYSHIVLTGIPPEESFSAYFDLCACSSYIRRSRWKKDVRTIFIWISKGMFPLEEQFLIISILGQTVTANIVPKEDTIFEYSIHFC